MGFRQFMRYDDVSRLLHDHRLRNYGIDILTHGGITEGPLYELFRNLMFNNEGDRHDRLRRLVSKAFAPRTVKTLLPTMQAFVDERTAVMVERGASEIVSDLAQPLSITAPCDVLGVPRSDIPIFERWVQDLGLAFGFMSPNEIDNAHVAVRQLIEYVDTLIAGRRARPADDLITALVHVEEAGDRLTYDELQAMIANILFGGYHATYHQISLAVMNLLEHPNFASQVAHTSERLSAAVEELLRCDPAAPRAVRVALTPVELDHTTIPEGELIMLSIVAANRDPDVWDEPDTLTLDRPRAARHLAFGHGIHHCLGAALARMQIEQTVRAVADHLSGWRLAVPVDELDWSPARAAFRGVVALPIVAG
ncbi:cytochrome P450 [Pseudonocardia alaniniphila]